MRNYELMFIIRPTLEDEAVNVVVENMKKGLEDMKAKINEVIPMGRKELAYEINTFKNGNYFLFKVEGDPAAIKEFDRVANINEDILRHIVVKIQNN